MMKVEELLDALEQGKLSGKLALSGYSLNNENFTRLCQIMAGNTTIFSLSLSGCHIPDLTSFSGVFLKNTALWQLDLSNCSIDDKGLYAITNALLHNASLLELNLSVNEIGDKGARYLANLLKKNHSLVKLDISYNGIDEAFGTLVRALTTNHTLLYFDGYENYGSDDEITVIDKLIYRNKLMVLELYDALLVKDNKKVTELQKQGVSLWADTSVYSCVINIRDEARRFTSRSNSKRCLGLSSFTNGKTQAELEASWHFANERNVEKIQALMDDDMSPMHAIVHNLNTELLSQIMILSEKQWFFSTHTLPVGNSDMTVVRMAEKFAEQSENESEKAAYRSIASCLSHNRRTLLTLRKVVSLARILNGNIREKQRIEITLDILPIELQYLIFSYVIGEKLPSSSLFLSALSYAKNKSTLGASFDQLLFFSMNVKATPATPGLKRKVSELALEETSPTPIITKRIHS